MPLVKLATMLTLRSELLAEQTRRNSRWKSRQFPRMSGASDLRKAELEMDLLVNVRWRATKAMTFIVVFVESAKMF